MPSHATLFPSDYPSCPVIQAPESLSPVSEFFGCEQDGDRQGVCAQQQGRPYDTVQGPGEWRQGEEEEEQQEAEQRWEGATSGSSRWWHRESFLGSRDTQIVL